MRPAFENLDNIAYNGFVTRTFRRRPNGLTQQRTFRSRSMRNEMLQWCTEYPNMHFLNYNSPVQLG